MDIKTQVKQLYTEGLSVDEIGRSLNLDIKKVEKILKYFKKKKRSSGEESMAEVLGAIYPFVKIEEQVHIDGLFMDFYIPDMRLCIE